MTPDTILILMATYNGAKHLRRQMDSLQAQTYTNWRLIIRDDGSTDETLRVLSEYNGDSRIQIVNVASARKGACANFSALYTWAKQNLDFDLLMFADQDDIWEPQKIEKTYRLMMDKSAQYPDEAIMIYSHLAMITEDGQPINDDFTLEPQLPFNISLAQNYALGCTTMLNKQLIGLMPEIPVYAENHDYWVVLVASGLGRCVFLNEKLLKYRQHSANVTSQGSSFTKRFKRFTTGVQKQVNTLERRIVMLKGFLQAYHNRLNPYNRQMLQAYISGFGSNWFRLLYTIKKYNIHKLNLLQDLGFLFVTAAGYSKLKKTAVEQGIK